MRPGAASAPPFQRIGIVGLGLIGGSIALAARRQWPAVGITGVDRPAVSDAALRLGIVDDGRDSVGALSDCDLVVLAAPIPAILELIHSASAVEAIVTDVGSTKRRIMAAAEAVGLRTFVGGHPMAGAAHGGIEHADASLFEEKPWLLVQGASASQDVDRVREFVAGLGAMTIVVEADVHDRIAAYVSHLPQLLATALMGTAGPHVGELGLAMAGKGLEDMTRLASSPFDIWQGIFETNADAIVEAIEALQASLPVAAAELRDPERMSGLFESARDWHARLRSRYSIRR